MLVCGLMCVVLASCDRTEKSVAPSPEELFRRYAADPIPESVAEMRVDQAKEAFGPGYVFRFKISRAALTQIVDSRSLRRVHNVWYRNGDLNWEWDANHEFGMAVYPPRWKREPAWFKPQFWDDPEAYAFREEKRTGSTTLVLLYNEGLGEGYFLAFKGHQSPR